jgi:hypothetical protein
VAELALNDYQRDALVSHFDCMRVPQLMWGKAAADSYSCCRAAELGSSRRARPVPPAGVPVDDAEERTDRELRARVEPWL